MTAAGSPLPLSMTDKSPGPQCRGCGMGHEVVAVFLPSIASWRSSSVTRGLVPPNAKTSLGAARSRHKASDAFAMKATMSDRLGLTEDIAARDVASEGRRDPKRSLFLHDLSLGR